MTKMDGRFPSDRWLRLYSASLTPQQELFVRDERSICKFIADPLGGCTHAGIVRFVARALDVPGIHVMMDGVGHASAETTRRRVRDMLKEAEFPFISSQPYQAIELPNGSVMQFRSLNVDYIHGMNINTAWLDNNSYATFDQWRIFVYRSKRTRGQAFYTGNVQWIPWEKSAWAAPQEVGAWRQRLKDAGMVFDDIGEW